MKLPLLTIVFPILLPLGRELLSPSSPNSVSDHKKNQPLWLASSTSGSASLAAPLFFFLQLAFLPASLIPLDYSNSK